MATIEGLVPDDDQEPVQDGLKPEAVFTDEALGESDLMRWFEAVGIPADGVRAALWTPASGPSTRFASGYARGQKITPTPRPAEPDGGFAWRTASLPERASQIARARELLADGGITDDEVAGPLLSMLIQSEYRR